MSLKWLERRHWSVVLLVMGAAALGFGLLSFNLFFFFKANLELIEEHGAMALTDGALQQLVELLVMGTLSLLLYLIFKACETIMVERLLK